MDCLGKKLLNRIDLSIVDNMADGSLEKVLLIGQREIEYF